MLTHALSVIGINEPRIKKNKSPLMNLAQRNLQQVKLCYTLVIIFPKDLEMIYVFTNLLRFIKILNLKKRNVTVGCIYRHSHMDLNELNDSYVNKLLDKLSKENKTVFLLDDFNIDLLNYNQH